MIDRPVFAPHLHVEVSEEEGVVYLLSEKAQFYLKGYLYCLLAPLLDGAHTVADIVDQLEVFYPKDQIEAALSRLEAQGFVIDAMTAGPPAEAAYWSLQGLDLAEVGSRLASSPVAVETCGAVEPDAFVSQLESLGVRTAPDAAFTIVLTDDYLQPHLGAVNRDQLGTGQAWLLVKPVGAVVWVGPLFVPGETGCWECLARRLRANREVETALQRRSSRSAPFPVARAALPSTTYAGMALAATQVALCLAEKSGGPLRGIVWTLDTANLESRKHVLVKSDECSACGEHAEEFPEPVEIVSRRKKFTEDGGHRIRSPAETLRRFGHLVSPVTGVVSELKPAFSGGSGLVSIYCGVHEIPGFGRSLEHLQLTLRNNATGKGRSEVQSQASAFSEAIERHSSLYRGDGYRVRRSVNEMEEDFVSLEACLHYSDAQYRDRDEWNRTHLLQDHIPIRLDPDRPIDWTPVWSLSGNSFKYVPTAHCVLGYYEDDPSDAVYFNHDSNGLAAGNVLEEAVLQGFLEVIERDCVAVWWYNRLKRPGVHLETFDDPYFEALKNYYATLDREFWVLDLTSDAGIPTFVAVSRRVNGDSEAITFGCGTHFNARLGISRALTEMNQALYLLSSGRTSVRARSDRELLMRQWNEAATIVDQPYVAPDATLPPVTLDTYPYRHTDDIKDDIDSCLRIADDLDLEVLVNDLTKPEIGMSVVKVIVPGLRTFRPRFAPGRLYDVPVKMGWRAEKAEESELNPIPWWL